MKGFNKLKFIISFVIFTFLLNTNGLAQDLNDQQQNTIDSINHTLTELNDVKLLDALYQKGLFLETVDLQIGDYFYEKALILARQMGNLKKEAQCLLGLGRIQLLQEKYIDAMQFYRTAFAIAKDNEFPRELVSAHNEIGISYYRLGAYPKALDSYYKALKLADSIGYNTGVNHAQNNLAIFYSINKDYRKSLHFFQEALKINEKAKDSTSIGVTASNIGLVYSGLHKYDSALQFLDYSLAVFENTNDFRNLSSVYNNRGSVNLEKGQVEMAYQDMMTSLSISERYDYQPGVLSVVLSLGSYFNKINQPDSALYFYKKALHMLYSREDVERSIIVYEGLRETYRSLNDYEQALYYSDKHEQANVELNSTELQKKISELQIRFDEERKTQEINVLRIKQRNERIILWLVIAGMLIIATLMIYSYRVRHLSLNQDKIILEKEKRLNLLEIENQTAENQQLQAEMGVREEIARLKQQQFEEKIEHKNRALSLSALQIVSKNEILQSIRNSMEKASESGDDKTVKMLKQLIREIDSNINLDDEWENFKIHFEEVHTGFFARLQEKNEGLTANDLRMCAYIKIGLDTKEISRILNLSVNAVEKRRYRLRKKLGLEPDDSITEYFNKI